MVRPFARGFGVGPLQSPLARFSERLVNIGTRLPGRRFYIGQFPLSTTFFSRRMLTPLRVDVPRFLEHEFHECGGTLRGHPAPPRGVHAIATHNKQPGATRASEAHNTFVFTRVIRVPRILGRPSREETDSTEAWTFENQLNELFSASRHRPRAAAATLARSLCGSAPATAATQASRLTWRAARRR